MSCTSKDTTAPQIEAVRVFVRIRPSKTSNDGERCVSVNKREHTITLDAKPEPKLFTFDEVADESMTQEEVFVHVGKDIAESCLSGYNGTIFAYGQTGSGKTYTMLGPDVGNSMNDIDNDTVNSTMISECRGLIPRTVEYLYSLMARFRALQGAESLQYVVSASLLEIYKESVYDLLDASPCEHGLSLREDIKSGVFVDGLERRNVASADEAMDLLFRGASNRRVASTAMNRESSRSHLVFVLHVQSREREPGGLIRTRESVLNLVDLAGSERQRDTGTTGVRLKEAGSINKSLSALGNVINALVSPAGGSIARHIPHRNSKLTFLLRDSLGGNALVAFVANVAPEARCFGETLSTLNFARRAKLIRNRAFVNEDTQGNVEALRQEILALKSQLMSNGSVSNTAFSKVFSDNDVPESKYIKVEEDNLLMDALRTAAISENGRLALAAQVQAQEVLLSSREKSLQTIKMVVKFREATISRLEKERKERLQFKVTGSKNAQELLIAELKERVESAEAENALLLSKPVFTPAEERLVLENMGLHVELDNLRKLIPSSTDEYGELERMQQYALRLNESLQVALDDVSALRSNDEKVSEVPPSTPKTPLRRLPFTPSTPGIISTPTRGEEALCTFRIRQAYEDEKLQAAIDIAALRKELTEAEKLGSEATSAAAEARSEAEKLCIQLRYIRMRRETSIAALRDVFVRATAGEKMNVILSDLSNLIEAEGELLLKPVNDEASSNMNNDNDNTTMRETLSSTQPLHPSTDETIEYPVTLEDTHFTFMAEVEARNEQLKLERDAATHALSVAVETHHEAIAAFETRLASSEARSERAVSELVLAQADVIHFQRESEARADELSYQAAQLQAAEENEKRTTAETAEVFMELGYSLGGDGETPLMDIPASELVFEVKEARRKCKKEEDARVENDRVILNLREALSSAQDAMTFARADATKTRAELTYELSERKRMDELFSIEKSAREEEVFAREKADEATRGAMLELEAADLARREAMSDKLHLSMENEKLKKNLARASTEITAAQEAATSLRIQLKNVEEAACEAARTADAPQLRYEIQCLRESKDELEGTLAAVSAEKARLEQDFVNVSKLVANSA